MTIKQIVAAFVVLGSSAMAFANYTPLDKASFRSVIASDGRVFILGKQPSFDLRHASVRVQFQGDKAKATLLTNKVPAYTGEFKLSLVAPHVTGPWAQQIGKWKAIPKTN
jgi:hypothetical protein